VYRESVQQLRQAQLQAQQPHRKARKPTIPPPHQTAMQKQLQQQQQVQLQQQQPRAEAPTQPPPPQPTRHEVAHRHYTPEQQQQLQQQQLYAQRQAQLLYEQQKAAAKQQLQQQKLYYQQQLQQQQQQQQQLAMTVTTPHVPSIMKQPKHHQYREHEHHRHHRSQYLPPVISPPEGFQSETPFQIQTDEEAELARKLHAKAQLYGTEPRHHKKEKKHKNHRVKSSPQPLPEPMSLEDSYELCVASDAELHTVGVQHHPSQHYFSLPRTSLHHRPASASPRNVQTLMRPQSTYRRTQEYEFNYTA